MTYRPELNCLDQHSPDLSAALAQHYLVPPSTEPYSEERIPDRERDTYSQFQQDRWLDTVLFRGLEGGFFIEAGADDSVQDSNTLLLELRRAWNGLLVEAQPTRAKLGRTAHRSARTTTPQL